MRTETAAHPAPDRTVWLARHASRLDFEDAHWHEGAPRPHDPPLSASGEREARALAARLATEGVDALFSSPFLRCVQTAACVAEALDRAIEIEPGLSEWLNREWFAAPPRLCDVAELLRVTSRIDPTYRPRGAARYGESGVEALRRSGDVARRLVDAFAGDLLLVGHRASLLGATAGLLGIDAREAAEHPPLPELEPACLVKLVRKEAEWTLALRADTSHLA